MFSPTLGRAKEVAFMPLPLWLLKLGLVWRPWLGLKHGGIITSCSIQILRSWFEVYFNIAYHRFQSPGLSLTFATWANNSNGVGLQSSVGHKFRWPMTLPLRSAGDNFQWSLFNFAFLLVRFSDVQKKNKKINLGCVFFGPNWIELNLFETETNWNEWKLWEIKWTEKTELKMNVSELNWNELNFN